MQTLKYDTEGQNAIDTEARIQQAINAIELKNLSISHAARDFQVPQATLCHRVHGQQSRQEAYAKEQNLTVAEEGELVR